MMLRGLKTILLLLASNTFMTITWYGHLKFKDVSLFKHVGLVGTILSSWGIALLEYTLMILANKIGNIVNGGPFNMWQLKLIAKVFFNIFRISIKKFNNKVIIKKINNLINSFLRYMPSINIKN